MRSRGRLLAEEQGNSQSEFIKDVYDIYGKVVGIGLEEYYRDIETRFELSTFAKTQNKPKDWEKRKDDLEQLIRRVLIHTTCEMKNGAAKPRTSELHRSLLRSMKPGDTIITFNYDTIIEESMPAANCLWTLRDGYGLDVTGLTHDWARKWLQNHDPRRPDRTEVELLKLHGSLNWQLYKTFRSGVRLKHRPYVVRSRRRNPVRDEAAILPPGWHKRVDRKPYSTIWQGARLKLDRCASLVIVGYSLPQTDLIARALFLEVNRSRRARSNHMKELHLADPDGQTKNKLIESFLPSLGHKGQVFRYKDAGELVDSWKDPRLHPLNSCRRFSGTDRPRFFLSSLFGLDPGAGRPGLLWRRRTPSVRAAWTSATIVGSVV